MPSALDLDVAILIMSDAAAQELLTGQPDVDILHLICSVHAPDPGNPMVLPSGLPVY
jgi:hypothetical protein